MHIRSPRLAGVAGQIGTIAITLLALLLLTFFIRRLMPADPVRAMVGEDATRETYKQVFRRWVSTGRSGSNFSITSAMSSRRRLRILDRYA